MSENLQATIDAAWEDRDSIGGETKGAVRQAVDQALAQLDTGAARVAEPDGAGGWRVNQWLKKAVLLSFRLNDMRSEEHTSELPSLMRISYAVFWLKKQKKTQTIIAT